MLILGIDISTTNIGFCIADQDDNIKEFFTVELNKYVPDKNIFKKVDVFEKTIEILFKKYEIDHVFIEQALSFFKEGGSMAATIILLNQFNILCQYVLTKKGIKYHMVASQTALKCSTGVGRKPAYEKDKKIWLSKLFEQKHPEIELKRKKDGVEIHPTMFDAVDA